MNLTCTNCTKKFERPQGQVKYQTKKGRKPFCTQSCASKYYSARRIKPPNVVCALCNKAFRLNLTRQNASKSGLFFCCRKHKDQAQKIGGIKEIQPAHYGTSFQVGPSRYRHRAFKYLPHKCDECGWSEIPEVLHVHHINLNRKNNEITNLRLLCGRCHDILHFLTKTGKWGHKTHDLAEITSPLSTP